MAVEVAQDVDAAPVAIAEEPQRRRVRRKPASASAATDTVLDTAIEPQEAEPTAPAAALDITPEEAAEAPWADVATLAEPVAVEPTIKPEPVAEEPSVALQPEADLSSIIANDPAQIAAPPEKPKRGWWRR